jgi:hypothetical protein
VLRVKPPGGVWEAVGADTAPGRAVDGVSCTANEWGPDTLQFSVARDGGVPWRDLLPFGEVELEAPGCGVVWGGRVWDTSYPDQMTVNVGCRGWQYALDDNLMRRVWVHNRLSDWRDIRSFPSAGNIADFAGSGALVGQVGEGVMTWGLAGGVTLPVATNGARTGWFFDGGETGAIKRVVVTWESANNTSSIDTSLWFSDSDPSLYAGGDSGYTGVATWNGGASGTLAYTLATARRYVALVANNNGASAYTPLGATWFRVTGAQLFRATAYESGNASVLKASDVVKDVRAGFLPLLSTDESRISTSSFSIPHLTTEGGYQTPRQVLQAVNAYHDWLVGVDAERRLFLMARPTTVAAVIGEWSGAAFTDAGDSGEELYNRVIVQGTGTDGQPLTAERTATSPVLSAASVTRSRVLSVNASLTTASAEAIGDAWLATRNARPTRGSITITGPTAARTAEGAPIPPAQFLRLVGQRVMLAHRWDPDTGGLGREGVITSVTWTPASDTAQITLDSPRDRLDVLLGRLAAVRGAGQPLQ